MAQYLLKDSDENMERWKADGKAAGCKTFKEYLVRLLNRNGILPPGTPDPVEESADQNNVEFYVLGDTDPQRLRDFEASHGITELNPDTTQFDWDAIGQKKNYDPDPKSGAPPGRPKGRVG